MQYRVYSGPKGSGEISPIAKEQMLFKEFAALDDALSWARHVEQGGASRCCLKVTTAPRWTAAPSPTRSGSASASRSAAKSPSE